MEHIGIKIFDYLEEIEYFLNEEKINNISIKRKYIDLKLENYRIDYASEPHTRYILIYKTNKSYQKEEFEPEDIPF